MPSLARFGYISFGLVVVFLLAMTWLAPATSTEFALQFERRMAGLEQQSYAIADFEMPALVGGEGPTLVLLHGFSANKDNFTRVARHLSGDFRLVIPDLPGFGEASAPADADYGLEAQRDRVIALLDTLGPDAPVHLGGSSMGGYLALAVALKAPERVASLWLLAPAGIAGAQISEVRQRFADTGEIPLLADSIDDYDRVMGLVFSEPPWLPGFVRRTLADRAVARKDHYARIFRQIYDSAPLNDAIDGLQVPAQVVWGEQDRVLHPSATEVFASAEAPVPVEIITMPGIGHLPMLEAPEASASAWLEFQARHFPSAPAAPAEGAAAEEAAGKKSGN